MKNNLNLQKIKFINVKHGLFSIRCEVCGYEIRGNVVDDIVDRANSLGWKYDSENDRVICRYCLHKEKEDENE